MSKLTKSAWGGLLFAFWLMCFDFPYRLFVSFQDHSPLSGLFGQLLIDFFVYWLICGVIAHGVIGLFDDLNKRGRRDDDDRNGGPGGENHNGAPGEDGSHKDDHTPKQ